MSADCHKPTLTFPKGAYNATQVRLYGIKQDSYVLSVDVPNKTERARGKIVNTVEILDNDPKAKQTSAEVQRLRKGGKTEEDIYGTISYENKAYSAYSTRIVIDLKKPGRYVDLLAISRNNDEPISCGIIVGYSYEGQCYDLPKPKIMLIPTIPELIPIDDCGYHEKSADKYMLWIVDKLDECVEFEMNQGFVEQIVLEANLPGKRSPTMYASRMMMGHRGGKLGD